MLSNRLKIQCHYETWFWLKSGHLHEIMIISTTECYFSLWESCKIEVKAIRIIEMRKSICTQLSPMLHQASCLKFKVDCAQKWNLEHRCYPRAYIYILRQRVHSIFVFHEFSFIYTAFTYSTPRRYKCMKQRKCRSHSKITLGKSAFFFSSTHIHSSTIIDETTNKQTIYKNSIYFSHCL